MKFFDMVMTRRFLHQSSVGSSEEELHLLALACFCLSIKLSSSDSCSCTKRMCTLSGGAFEPMQIVEEERKVLETLDWRMNPPLAHDFLPCYTSVVPSSLCQPVQQDILDLANYMIELAVLDHFFVEENISPSYIALSALSNAIVMVAPPGDCVDPLEVVADEFQVSLDDNVYVRCCRRLLDIYGECKGTVSQKIASGQGNHRTSSPTSATQDPMM
jgi:hypothetical protein